MVANNDLKLYRQQRSSVEKKTPIHAYSHLQDNHSINFLLTVCLVPEHSPIPVIYFLSHPQEAVFSINHQPSPYFCFRCQGQVFSSTNTGHDLHVISAKLCPSTIYMHSSGSLASTKQGFDIFNPEYSTVNAVNHHFPRFENSIPA